MFYHIHEYIVPHFHEDFICWMSSSQTWIWPWGAPCYSCCLSFDNNIIKRVRTNQQHIIVYILLDKIIFCQVPFPPLFSCLKFPFCLSIPSFSSDAGEWAYNNAVKHVNGALAVGVSEETDDFLRVVERLAPDLFSNIYSAYKQPISMAG